MLRSEAPPRRFFIMVLTEPLKHEIFLGLFSLIDLLFTLHIIRSSEDRNISVFRAANDQAHLNLESVLEKACLASTATAKR